MDGVREQERVRRPLQALMEYHDLRGGPALEGLTLWRPVISAEQVQVAGHVGRAAAQVARDGKVWSPRGLLRVSAGFSLEVDLGPALAAHDLQWGMGRNGVPESGGGVVSAERAAAMAQGARRAWPTPTRWRIPACWCSGQTRGMLGRLLPDPPLHPCRC